MKKNRIKRTTIILSLNNRDVNKDLTPKDQDKDKDLLDLTPQGQGQGQGPDPKDQDKDKDLKYVLKESLRTRTRINITDCKSINQSILV